MTTVPFPSGAILHADLRINGGQGNPLSLEPGELYIDEIARCFWVKTASGILPVSLDVMGIAPLPRGTDPSWVLLKTPTGSEWGPLYAGGGGQPLDDRPWRVPGLAPAALGSLAFPAAGGASAVFEIASEAILDEARIRVLTGAGAVTLKLQRFDGELGDEITTVSLSFTGPGAYTASASGLLTPGLYAWTWTATGTFTLETVQGYLTWSRVAEAHPVSMRVS